MSLISAAKGFVKKGFSVIACDSMKTPAVPAWKKYQSQIATAGELEDQFKNPRAKGLAIICGTVSGSLEVIDVDTKYDLTGELFNNLMLAITDAGLAGKLLVVETRSGGYHLYYRCDIVQGNQKLAERPASDEELKENPNIRSRALIETRGEGGYVIAPPSDGYKKIDGEIHRITVEERETILTICRSFNELIIEQQRPPAARTASNKYAVTPWEDYNSRGVDHLFDVLEKHGWQRNDRRSTKDKVRFKRPGSENEISGDYCYSLNLFMVFTTNSPFEPQKGYKPASAFAVLECNGDFKEAARKLAAMGYGEGKQHYDNKLEKNVFQKKLEGYSKEDLVKYVAKETGKDEEAATNDLEQMEKQWGETICAFWDVLIDSENKKKIVVNKTRFIQFLHEVGGFGLYFYDHASNIYRIVRVQDGLADESSTEQMKKFIVEYVSGLPDSFDKGTTPEVLLEIVVNKYAALFNEGLLEFLPHINLDLLRDDKDKSFFPFRNGVIVVTKDAVEIRTYKEIGKIIWKSQVIDFDIHVDQNFAPETCEFYQFIEKISGGEDDRLHFCLTVIGYLLHRYKDPGRPWAIILAEETENEKDGGGTGKGILIKAISKLINTVKVNGKGFNPDKNFVWQRVTLQTQLIAIEDCDKNLDFEKFNSHITEGATVEKKNKDELFIEYKDSPKMIFTTNYTVNIKGNHGKRRSKVFEFSPFFNPSNKPDDFFGHLLFDDWDKEEYNRFYNLLFFCLSIYLTHGVLEVVNSEKLRRKQIRLQWGDEFLEWYDHYSGNGCNEWKPFKELYNNFKIENDIETKDYSAKRFKKAIETSTELCGKRVQTKRNKAKNNQHEVRICENDNMNDEKVLDVDKNEMF
jgi:hypothetical protein